MALTSENNITPRTTLTPEDIAAVVRDTMGEVKAEQVEEERKKALAELDDPDYEAKKAEKVASKAAEMAAIAAGKRLFGIGKEALKDKGINEMKSHEKADLFACALMANFQARQQGGGHDQVLALIERAGHKTLHKELQAGDFTSSGFLLAPTLFDGVIEELRPRVVYIRNNPEDMQIPQGGLSMPYEDDGPDGSWVAEGEAATAEEEEGGQLHLQPHKLITVQALSNDLLRGPMGVNSQRIVNAMIRGMRVTLDATLLRGLGTSSEPMGLRGLVQTANKFDVTSGATITQAVLVREILQMQELLQGGDIDTSVDRPVYFMSSRTMNFLKAQRATDGILFPSLDTGNTLMNVPLDFTSSIPNTLNESGTAANDESEIYLVAMANMLLGRNLDFLVDIEPGAAYNNSSGTVVSGLSKDVTPIRVIGKWDHADLQRGKSIAMAQEVDWALA